MRRSAVSLCLGVACAVVLVRTYTAVTPVKPAATTDAKPWLFQPATNGFSLTWDRRAPALRDASRVEMVLHRDGQASVQALDRTVGTLVVPYMPEAAVLRVDSKVYPLYGEVPSTPISPPPVVASPSRAVMRVPMLLSNRQKRHVSTASVILPRVPNYVHRRHEIDLLVKVAPNGKVTSVASDSGDDPLRRRLSAVASDAISRWQFDGVTVNSFREGKIRVLFTPGRVSVRPAG